MTTKQLKNRGFTLVELLIVIVIIAILTVISLIAYNGIQNRARTTTAESTAKSVADKAQIYYSQEGKYPDSLATMTGAAAKETYNISSNAITSAGDTNVGARPDKENTVSYKKCNDDSALVTYWNYNDNATGYRRLGTLSDTATSC